MNKMKKTIKLIITLLIFNLNYSQQYDLVVKNGFLIDAKNNINKTMDIAIKEGKIASVERKIDASLAKKVIDAKGLVVTPGLIDIQLIIFMVLNLTVHIAMVLILYHLMDLLSEQVLPQLLIVEVLDGGILLRSRNK